MSIVSQPVFCRSFGQGQRKVLALHCTLAHSGAWRGIVEAMGSDVTFVTPDMLSHGRSPDWDRQGDYQDRGVTAVEPFLDEPMDIIGHSFGATIALRLAVAHPGKVRSLTMIEPVYFAVVIEDDPAQVADHDVNETGYLDALDAGDDALAARLFNRMWSDGGLKWPDMPEQMRASMTRSIHVVPACRPSLLDDLPGMLKPGVLDRVTCPSLLLRGSRSPSIIKTVNDGLARRLPDADNRVVEGAGHMVPISHPVETAAILRDLFARSPV
ncbi:MAG: alpha/beta hydrolase [Rhodobacteraceae bacterium]|nr:alpha/beta hydrolase [Paracoccaceae bacterium]